MIIDDHPKHKDHLVDQTMIIDDDQKHIDYLMVDQPSTVARHAGQRLVRELRSLPQSPEQYDGHLCHTRQRYHCFLQRETDLAVNVAEKF